MLSLVIQTKTKWLCVPFCSLQIVTDHRPNPSHKMLQHKPPSYSSNMYFLCFLYHNPLQLCKPGCDPCVPYYLSHPRSGFSQRVPRFAAASGDRFGSIPENKFQQNPIRPVLASCGTFLNIKYCQPEVSVTPPL